MGSTEPDLVSLRGCGAGVVALGVKASGSMEAERALAAASELDASLTIASPTGVLLAVGSSNAGGNDCWRTARVSEAMKNR